MIVCAWCGAETPLSKVGKMFCSKAHKQRWHSLQVVRGQSMVLLVQAWRMGRHVKVPKLKDDASAQDRAKAAKARRLRDTANWAFQQMAALADRYNAADVGASRMSALEFAAAKQASGWDQTDL